jgi:serine/threonine protein kinase
MASGLNATHHAGIIHRDIKPHNVLITTEGVAQLTDFGIAHARDMTALTRTGARLGTPHYMSPEQVDGGAADERSDIYSLGCMMYHMLTGAPPFNAESAESAMAVMRMPGCHARTSVSPGEWDQSEACAHRQALYGQEPFRPLHDGVRAVQRPDS